MKEWLTIKDVTEIYGFSPNKQYLLREKKEIPFAKIGGSIRYNKKTLDEWIESKMSD